MRRAFVALSLASGVLVVGLAIGCGGDEPATSAAHFPQECPHSKFHLSSGITPGKIIRGTDPVTAETRPEVNRWTAGTRRGGTTVYASGTKEDGMFAIHHWRACNPDYERNHIDEISVAGVGRVKITHAPLGRDVVGWAPDHGKLEFTTKSGITGTLYLRDQSISLDDPPGVERQSCPAIRDFPSDPRNALAIEVRGPSCDEAERFIRSVHAMCELGDCQLDGFTCEGVDELTQAIIVECANGSRRLGWTWSIGY